jgi:hypothetical protein
MSDYSALAQRVSLSITGVRGCLMLSRDGMILGAYPEGDAEGDLRAAWVRFAGVGDPERSYIEFPDQTWAFVRRGAYGAFAIADIGVRPGVLVDMLEQALMAGEQDRVHDREMMRLPEAPSAPSGKPRTSLHKPERPGVTEPEPTIVGSEEPIPVMAAEVAAGSGGPAEAQPAGEAETAVEEETVTAEATASETDAAPHGEVPDGDESPHAQEDPEGLERKEDETEVDRILLAKEFAGLLQVPRDDDEASR